MDYTYTVHGILQARILEWIAFPFSKGSSQPRNRTEVSCIAGRFFTNWDIKEDKVGEQHITNSTSSSTPKAQETVSKLTDEETDDNYSETLM